ncbi:hypothetical protein ACLGI4_27605 [Streptomyces sp. HMX112]|uniref:hypothetical protein n=1 Tax=Streptomyces sp. HMX112 TaxID=3390850 RepID=UPI003A81077F
MSADDMSFEDEWPLPPAWMFDCTECARLYRVMKHTLAVVDELRLTGESGVDHDPMDSVPGSQIGLAHHLALAHRELVPDWTPGCPRCADHRGILDRAPSTGSLLVAAEHRAAHLFIPPGGVGIV